MNNVVDGTGKFLVCESSGKRCYNGREAGRIINACKRHRNNDHLGRNKDLPRRKYFCKECGSWHLTKMPRFDRESRECFWEVRYYREMERGRKRG